MMIASRGWLHPDRSRPSGGGRDLARIVKSLGIHLHLIAKEAMTLKRTIAKQKQSYKNARESLWRRRLHYFETRQEEIVSTIRELVEIESPSDNKPAADRLGTVLAEKFRALGGTPRLQQTEKYADHVQVDFPGTRKTSKAIKPVLLLGHFDTVYPLGTLAHMPCKVVQGRLHGPGVLDMKSGIALMLHAIEALQTWHGALPRPVTVFLVSDEEVGSRSSREITESLARKSAAVFVLEPAAGVRGAVKTARKGVGEYMLNVRGIAAHAGLDPSKGHSAILELSRQIAALAKLNNLRNGISVNPGVIQGGTRSNVVAAEAFATIDVRIKRARQAAGIDCKLRSLKPFDRHCQLEIAGGINRLPMERTPGVAALYRQARQLAQQIDWDLEEAAVGGGSDGNFTAGMGIPTLDGMGGAGDGAHASHEYVIISELPRRALLLAAMIESG
jgi:glutamate carboxypeptidase